MEGNCELEVLELHSFFESWFHGAIPADQAALKRLESALADDFRMITPAAKVMGKDRLLEALGGAHARARDSDPPLQIRIDNITITKVTDDVTVATYEEWQEGPEGRNGRLSSAVFRSCKSAPNGVEWVHLHEIWLERP